VCHSEHLKSSDEQEADKSSLTSVSKQRKVTENTDSLSRNMQVLGAASADVSALLSVSKAEVVSKQEGMASEVVHSDVDFGGLDDDLYGFCDILKSMNGCEFTSEFQKCLSESERDDSNINFSSGDLMCLSVSDVTDAITEKLTAPQHGSGVIVSSQHGSGESVPSLQTAGMSFQSFEPLHGQAKYFDVQSNTQALPVDNYSMQLWHQNLQVCEPVMPQWQLLSNSLPASCAELLKYETVSMKQHPSLRRQLQSHDAQSMSRTQSVQQHQQPQRNQVQSLYPSHVSAKQLLEQQTLTQQEWQTPAHWMPQLLPCQTVQGICNSAVKKEMPLSVVVSSVADAAVRLPQQMLSTLSVNTGHGLLPAGQSQVSMCSACQPMVQDCNRPQHLPPCFLMNQNQKGVYANFSQMPEFGSSLHFMPHGATEQLFGGHASEANLIRNVAQGSDSAFPLVSSDMLISAHQLIEHENIPTNPESTGR